MRTASLYAGLAMIEMLVGLSAVAGGLCLLSAPRGGGILQLPLSLLDGSPFSDYVIPGLVLCLVVGGSNVAAAIPALLEAPAAIFAALIAGAIGAGWIAAEVAFIGYHTWAQVLYFFLGILTMALALTVRNRRVAFL